MSLPHPPIKLALVDDHTLFRKGMISLIDMVSTQHAILFEADNGFDMQQKIDKANLPDIILMDVNMPTMDGFAAVQWLKQHHPEIKVLVVSMVDREETVVQMIKLGVKGYLNKDIEPKVLGQALEAIANKGFYYTDFVTGILVHSLQWDETKSQLSASDLSEREKEFLRLSCKDITYQEISEQMNLSPKTIDGYRNVLFDKLKAKSRVGLVVIAIRTGLVVLD